MKQAYVDCGFDDRTQIFSFLHIVINYYKKFFREYFFAIQKYSYAGE